MEIYFLTRGNKMWVDQFAKEMQGQYLPTRMKLNEKGQIDENGKEQDIMVQAGLRPIQLWCVAFPKEHKDLMLTTLFGSEAEPRARKYQYLDKYVAILRKFMKLDKIKFDYNKTKLLPLTKLNVDFIPLGTKDDDMYKWGEGI